jgi:cvfA/B/C family virulence factor
VTVAAELTVIRWRDIPAQVVARSGRDRASVQLPDRFQEAIDTAATRVGLIGTDDYLAEWRRDSRPCGDDLEAEAQTEAQRLEAAFGPDELSVLARSGGVGAAGPA